MTEAAELAPETPGGRVDRVESVSADIFGVCGLEMGVSVKCGLGARTGGFIFVL